MATTEKLSVTFDGVNEVPRLTGQSPVEWYDKGLTTYSIWYSGPKDKFVFTGNLTGTDWKLKYLRPASDDNKTIIKDLDSGAGREIRYLELGWNSDVDLISTRARYVFGWDGDEHSVTLGAQTGKSTYSINLYAKQNTIVTGDGFVHNIATGGEGVGKGDDITIQSGNADSISTWNRDDKITLNGHANYVKTDGGDDVVVVGANGAGTVRMDDGNDRITTGAGWVELISTGDGDDIANIGKGGTGLLRMSDGDDIAKISSLAAGDGFTINGGRGSDTLDFSKFNNGVTFTLDGFGVFQNVTAPGSLTGGQGWFSESGIENLIGTKKADVFTGDFADNVLKGQGGNDRLKGGDGNDRLEGGNGNDRLFGEVGKDTLVGGKGNDILEGGKGNDSLRGNAGADIFVFGKNSGTDKVVDFADGTDLLRIADHTGGFSGLAFADQGANLKITHDGGVILLMGEAGTTLTSADFDFV